MESLSNKKKQIVVKPLNFWERAYLPAIVQGLSITMSHFFRKPVTIQYPEQKREFSENYRGLHSLKRDEVKCTHVYILQNTFALRVAQRYKTSVIDLKVVLLICLYRK